ncbi:hypothetical protein [Lederbergia galactosidilytica]|uniref:Uncharacterized protein n=1 Tax=Lederbergia galactosidilytica TaxID=217031 RepID=A0A178A6D3_9BACI|nr:hypothetical protein [Lederbergia galactosidilytica]KRG16174.1 hypothetical protein ACA30_02565 [Virgibacillus soli]MBP1914037.1 hypothetical protein [Lederbergia galactosidilytica]OAK75604.1 hypothetical protein ABB05_01205 [Lederbergia galactosidilytica]
MKHKKVFILSMIISVGIVLFFPTYGKSYGFPFSWITYHGSNEITNHSLLFSPLYLPTTEFDPFAWLLDVFIIYFFLIGAYKLLQKLEGETL